MFFSTWQIHTIIGWAFVGLSVNYVVDAISCLRHVWILTPPSKLSLSGKFEAW